MFIIEFEIDTLLFIIANWVILKRLQLKTKARVQMRVSFIALCVRYESHLVCLSVCKCSFSSDLKVLK